jgi:hypothetical protein
VVEAAERCRQSDRPASGEDIGDDLAGVGLTADDPDRILHVDPAELISSANVRVDPRLNKTFLASIKADGLASIKADGLAEVITFYRNESEDLVRTTPPETVCGNSRAQRVQLFVTQLSTGKLLRSTCTGIGRSPFTLLTESGLNHCPHKQPVLTPNPGGALPVPV